VTQVVSTNRLLPFRLAPSAGLLLLLLLLTACFGGGDPAQNATVTPGAVIPLTGSLVCSPSCLSQGQCGTTVDGRIVILAHNTQPATRDHNVILPNESAVNILGQEPRNLVDAAGNPFSLNFFVVQPTAGGPTSWVAGSCVNQTAPQ
jgi:hypothetical protein